MVIRMVANKWMRQNHLAARYVLKWLKQVLEHVVDISKVHLKAGECSHALIDAVINHQLLIHQRLLRLERLDERFV